MVNLTAIHLENAFNVAITCYEDCLKHDPSNPDNLSKCQEVIRLYCEKFHVGKRPTNRCIEFFTQWVLQYEEVDI